MLVTLESSITHHVLILILLHVGKVSIENKSAHQYKHHKSIIQTQQFEGGNIKNDIDIQK